MTPCARPGAPALLFIHGFEREFPASDADLLNHNRSPALAVVILYGGESLAGRLLTEFHLLRVANMEEGAGDVSRRDGVRILAVVVNDFAGCVAIEDAGVSSQIKSGGGTEAGGFGGVYGFKVNKLLSFGAGAYPCFNTSKKVGTAEQIHSRGDDCQNADDPNNNSETFQAGRG